MNVRNSRTLKNIINYILFVSVAIFVVYLRERYKVMINVKYDVLIYILIYSIYAVISFPINCFIERKKDKRRK